MARDERLGSARTPLRLLPELERLGIRVTALFAEDLPQASGRAAQLTAPLRVARAVARHAAGADIVDIAGADGFAYFRYARRRYPRQGLIARSNGLWDLVLANEEPGGKSATRQVLSDVYQRQVICNWERDSIRRSHAAVFLSRRDAEEAVRRGWKGVADAVAVQPGVDGFFVSGTPLEERRDVAFAGTFMHRKGRDVVARVMSELLRERPGLRLALFGTNMSADAVTAHFAPDVRARIDVSAQLSPPALARALERFAVFLFPTRYEGFGIVTSEAMASGLAVVTTDTGAGGDLVRDGENGLLVPVGDAGAARAAVARLLDDPALRVRLAGAGRATASALTWARAGEQLAAVYERALAPAQHGQRVG